MHVSSDYGYFCPVTFQAKRYGMIFEKCYH